jgi:hypothetical protein
MTVYGEGAHPLLIGDSDTSLMGCGIESITPTIYVLPLDTAKLGLQSATAATVGTAYFNFFPDTCSQSVAVAVSNKYGNGILALSQSQFTLDPNSLMSHSSIGTSRIYGVAPTVSGIAILTASGLYFGNSTTALLSVSGIPSGLNSLRYVSYCDATASYSSWLNKVVVAWDSSATTTASTSTLPIYLSINGGQSFTTVTVNVALAGVAVGGSIKDVAIQHSSKNLAILVRDAGNYHRIVLYDLVLAVFTQGYSFQTNASPLIDTKTGSAPRLVSMPMGELIIYGDNLYYSPNGGYSLFLLNLDSRDSRNPAAGLTGTEYIRQVAIGSAGAYAALTSTNRYISYLLVYKQSFLTYDWIIKSLLWKHRFTGSHGISCRNFVN